jgi:hypothetical protein
VVVDLLWQAHFTPVAITITGGKSMVKEAWNCHRVSKRDLVRTV